MPAAWVSSVAFSLKTAMPNMPSIIDSSQLPFSGPPLMINGRCTPYISALKAAVSSAVHPLPVVQRSSSAARVHFPEHHAACSGAFESAYRWRPPGPV